MNESATGSVPSVHRIPVRRVLHRDRPDSRDTVRPGSVIASYDSVDTPTVAIFQVAGRYQHRQHEAMTAFDALDGHYDKAVCEIAPGVVDDYATHYAALWRCSETLVCIEQDIVVTNEMIDALLACPYPACAQAYWISPASSGRLDALLCARRDGRTVAYGDEWADYTGIGCIKLRRIARKLSTISTSVRWNELEGEVNRQVSSFSSSKWHLHWPAAKHNHGFKEG